MIRPLVAADVEAAVALLVRAGLSGGAQNVHRYLQWEPAGAWCDVGADGALIATATVLRFGEVGFVGCMAVDPDVQRTGIGRRLLAHAMDAARADGATTFLLEATPAGEPLYAKMGYIVESRSVIMTRTPSGMATGAGAHASPPPPAALAASDHRDAVALDARAAGTPRDKMIAPLLAAHGGAVVRDRAGAIAGYGLVVGERLGPVIARDDAAGAELVAMLAPATTVCTAPLANPRARDALLATGFTDARELARMRLGPAIAHEPSWIWTMASPGAG